ncbi:MAG: hypothetical protein GY835_10360 [bacterium]|nr:hypothetical protein [bacterium]
MRRNILLSILGSLMIAAQAWAAVELRFDPFDGTIAPGLDGVLAIHVDEEVEIRTIEVRLTFDENILESLSGEAGELFEGAPCSLFEDFQDETIAGEWYGMCVTLGADCWVTGPGELYRWNFNALVNGISPITVLQIRLFDPAGLVIEDVTLPGTSIIVSDGTAVSDRAPGAISFTLSPNPFNPCTRLRFASMSEGPATVEAFDLTGRRLASVWQGELGPAGITVNWYGCGDDGETLPSGIYLLRLQDSSGETQTRRAVLLK